VFLNNPYDSLDLSLSATEVACPGKQSKDRCLFEVGFKLNRELLDYYKAARDASTSNSWGVHRDYRSLFIKAKGIAKHSWRAMTRKLAKTP
jgi:hypothetical protein